MIYWIVSTDPSLFCLSLFKSYFIKSTASFETLTFSKGKSTYEFIMLFCNLIRLLL
jgi:hypothetical protein